MVRTDLPIYLASKSPRRKKLLHQINLKFEVIQVDVDESRIDHEPPAEMVKRLAREKLQAAKDVMKYGIIITADTIVVIDDEILGKPSDADEAEKMLKKLSGRAHIVYTGFAVSNSSNGKEIIDYEKTLVTFIQLSDEDIRDYVKAGSPMDKAGGYGIQDDFGAVFIKEISGCYYNVVGLPLSKLYNSLKKIV